MKKDKSIKWDDTNILWSYLILFVKKNNFNFKQMLKVFYLQALGKWTDKYSLKKSLKKWKSSNVTTWPNLNCVFCTCSETFLTNSELIITGRSGIEMLGVTEWRALMTSVSLFFCLMRPPGVTVKCPSCVDTKGPAPAHHRDKFGFG